MTRWFTIYTTSAFECKWCKMAKELLSVYGINWFEKDIHENATYLQEFKDHGFKTVPQVFDEENLIGGYEATEKYLRLKHSQAARDEALASRLTRI